MCRQRDSNDRRSRFYLALCGDFRRLCDDLRPCRMSSLHSSWLNGQVERMNRTLKEATVKRYHYDNHAQLREYLVNFLNAYNFAKRLKTLKGLTPYEYIIKCWQNMNQNDLKRTQPITKWD